MTLARPRLLEALEESLRVGRDTEKVCGLLQCRVLVGRDQHGISPARRDLDGDTVVGEVTSGALSPTLGHPIALAYVDPALTDPGLPLEADVRGARVPVTVSTLPFYSRKES